MKAKQKIILFFIFIVSLIICAMLYLKFFYKFEKPKPPIIDKPLPFIKNTTFEYDILKKANKEENYMISPLSIEYAFHILNEGSDGITKQELDNVFKGYDLTKINNVEDKISLANALFLKNSNKYLISDEYINKIKDKYDADVIYDDFVTPDVLNDWVNKKTFKMIPKLVNNLSEDFTLGIVNTLAINLKWKYTISCHNTKKDIFNLINNETINTPFMHSENDNYIETENAKGIIRDYEEVNGTQLEYIAILPNDNLSDYVNNFNKEELTKLLNSQKKPTIDRNIDSYLPKYNYDYTYENIVNALNELGINEAFNQDNANFKKMLNKNVNENIYVSDVIHKTHIEVNEVGTKAAAATAIIMDKNAAFEMPKESIEIKFNKPFMYIIKEKNNDNIWFIGTVYTPEEYNEETSKCVFELN